MLFGVVAGRLAGPGITEIDAAMDTKQKKEAAVISSEAFLASPAAQFFQAGDYERALEAFESLLGRYPQDPLLRRYQAMCLDRLGRSEEALEIFKALLKDYPSHVPTLYFLGQAYFRTQQWEEAATAWQKVQELGRGTPYAEWAGEVLKRFGPTAALPAPSPPRWRMEARYGYEYDSNVVLKPNDESLANPGDQNSNRHTLGTRLNYRALAGKTFVIEGLYEFQQTLHDDSLDEFNFTFQEFGVNARKQTQAGGRSVIWGLQYSALPGFLNGDIFSFTNRWMGSLDTRWTPRTRTNIFGRWSASDFGPDGSQPADTSRDGFYQDIGFTHYWFPRDRQSHVFVHEEFNSAFTRGDNFDRLGNMTRMGVHVPVGQRLGVDVSGGFRFGGYPNFSSISAGDTSRRRDTEWDIHVSLIHALTRRVAVRGFYRFIKSVNQNNFFDYDRHIGGVEFTFAQG